MGFSLFAIVLRLEELKKKKNCNIFSFSININAMLHRCLIFAKSSMRIQYKI